MHVTRKSKKRAKKRRDKKKTGVSMALKRRVMEKFPHQEMILGPPDDGIKMSAVLKEFVKPYREQAETKEAYWKLLVVAAIAWNATLFPETERQSQLDELLLALPEDIREAGREIIEELIVRKEKFFSQYRRLIIDFELADLGKNWHLSVVSMPVKV